jgi:hypothetical protein
MFMILDILDRVLLTGALAAHTFKQQWFAGRDHYWSWQSKSKRHGLPHGLLGP